MNSKNLNRLVSYGRMICDKCEVEKMELFTRVGDELWCKMCLNEEQNTQNISMVPTETLDESGGNVQNVRMSGCPTESVENVPEQPYYNTETATNYYFYSDEMSYGNQYYDMMDRNFQEVSNVYQADAELLDAMMFLDTFLSTEIPQSNIMDFEESMTVSSQSASHFYGTPNGITGGSGALAIVDSTPAFSTTPICFEDSTTEPSLEDEPVVKTCSGSEVIVFSSTSNMAIDSVNMDIMDTNSPVKSSSNGSTFVVESQTPERSYSPEDSAASKILSKKNCQNCGKLRGYRGGTHPETGVPLCQNCHRYFKKHGFDRPSSLFSRCPKRSSYSSEISSASSALSRKSCHNCGKLRNCDGRIHPETRVPLCRPCYRYFKVHGIDKPSSLFSSCSEKSCHNCGELRDCEGRNHPETGVPLCQNCYRYFKKHGIDRPSSLFNRRPKNQPDLEERSVCIPGKRKRFIVICTHCESTTSQLQNRHHPITGNILCQACLTYYYKYKKDRPAEVIQAARERSSGIPREKKRFIVKCTHCHSSRLQMQARRHPITGKNLCNTCASYYFKYGKDRPADLLVPRKEKQM